MATPFNAVNSYLEFRDAGDVDINPDIKLFSSDQYTDLNSWYPLEKKELYLKPTKFADGRLRFLDREDSTTPPQEFKDVVSGEYEIKTWRKEGNIISIDGENTVFIKLSSISNIISWTSPERLPTFLKNWKPIVFILNENLITVRLTSQIALVIKRADEKKTSFNVFPISYTDGFCCVHPVTEQAIIYGSYVTAGGHHNGIALPVQPGNKEKWRYNVQFYEWGGLICPKSIQIIAKKRFLKVFSLTGKKI